MAYLPTSLNFPTATGDSAGVVQPDGTSIVINGGVISAASQAGVAPQQVTVFWRDLDWPRIAQSIDALAAVESTACR